MTADDCHWWLFKIRGEKLQYNINRDGAKVLALLSVKIDKCKYLTAEKYYPPIKAKESNKPHLHILF